MTTSHPSDPAPGRRPRLRGGLVGAGAAACAVCCTTGLMTLFGIGVTGAAATALTAAFAGVVFAPVVAAATVVELGLRPDQPGRAAP